MRTAHRVLALGAAALAGLGVLTGCSTATASTGDPPQVAVLRVGRPLRAPVWDYNNGSVMALTGDGRVARVQPSGATTVSAPLPGGVGDDLAITYPGGDVVFVPQPAANRVAVVSDHDLRRTGTLSVGPHPRQVSYDSGAKDLLAMSANDTTVTGVDVYKPHFGQQVLSEPVSVGAGGFVIGAKRGRRISYHAAGPGGVAFYKGDTTDSKVTRSGQLPVPTTAARSDLVKSSQLYYAARGTGTLLAADQGRYLTGFSQVGHAAESLPAPIDAIGVDQTRIYVVAGPYLAVYESDSFTGFTDEVIPLVETVDLRPYLPAGSPAPVSGIAVTPTLSGAQARVYLTVKGRPEVLSVAKPACCS